MKEIWPSVLTVFGSLGMLSSFAFAARPLWFLDCLDRKNSKRPLWKIIFSVLCLSGLLGWHTVFQAAARSILHISGAFLAEIMTAAVCWLIYLAAGRGESLAHAEKLRHQAERNAAIRSRSAE